MNTKVNCDVVVIGAGYAGLIAARDLIEAGKSVVVLEAGSRVGGRAWSKDTALKAVLDWGAEWVLPAHHHALMAETKRYGVALEKAGETPLPRWQVNGKTVRASVAEMVLANPGVQKILNRLEAASAVDGDWQLQTLAGFLADENPNDVALVNAVLFSLTGANPADLGIEMVLNEIRYHGGSVLETIDPTKISRVEGGTGAIAKRIAAELPEGTIRFGCSVNRVEQQGEIYAALGAFGYVKAQKIILALPLNVLKNIVFSPALPDRILQLFKNGHAGQTAKFWALAMGESQPEECFISGHPFQLTYAKPIGKDRDGQNHYYICAQALIDDVPDKSHGALKALFEEIYPGQTIIRPDVHDWVSDPFALGSWHAGRPGQEAALRSMREMTGGIIFCGGDFSDNWSGWIEGAILSGASAARTFS